MIEICATGPLATIQDLGRPGFAHLGVSPSGAADLDSHRLANRLVANPENAATIEATYGGLIVTSDRGCTVALTGAEVPLTVGGRRMAINEPLFLPPGRLLAVGAPTRGLRSYLAVRGGIGVDEMLGSRSTDILGGIGPRQLRPGDRLPVLPPGPDQPPVDLAPVRAIGDVVEARIEPGPRIDWITIESTQALTSVPWQVSSESNRVGVRLNGAELVRRRTEELPPEGVVRGAVQIPPNGLPIIFLADHPVTGGYPVVAVVGGHGLARIAQARPGQRVQLSWAPVPVTSGTAPATPQTR